MRSLLEKNNVHLWPTLCIISHNCDQIASHYCTCTRIIHWHSGHCLQITVFNAHKMGSARASGMKVLQTCSNILHYSFLFTNDAVINGLFRIALWINRIRSSTEKDSMWSSHDTFGRFVWTILVGPCSDRCGFSHVCTTIAGWSLLGGWTSCDSPTAVWPMYRMSSKYHVKSQHQQK